MRILCFAFLALNLLILVAPFPKDHPDDPIMVQSPITISLRDSIIIDNMKPLEFHGHWKKEGNATLLNSGKSAKITFRGRSEMPYITGGPFEDEERYVFEQMHFHWGQSNDNGAEHEIDGQTYSMEAHLVHYNQKYGDFKTAAKEKNGLVVVAFFIHAYGEENDKDFSKITDNIPNIQEALSKCTIDSDSLKWMTSQELSRHYYTYHGSLTSPPYDECVTWIIYQAPVFVSNEQIEVFRQLRSLKTNERIELNSRPVQISDEKPTIIFSRNTRPTRHNSSENVLIVELAHQRD